MNKSQPVPDETPTEAEQHAKRKSARQARVARRLLEKEEQQRRVKKENEEYYQNSTAWHSPRGKR